MPNEEGESLLDALNAGLTPDDPPEQDEPEVEAPEGDDPAGEEAAEEEAPEGEETPEGEEEEAEGEEGDEEEGEGEEKPAPKKPEAKEPDDLNDPIPKGTLERTQKRITNLVDRVKTQSSEIETLRLAAQARDELVGHITGAGMDGEKFGVLLDYAAGVNSGDPVKMQRSYDILMSELTYLAGALGHTLPGQNPLQGHADLIKEVEEKKLTEARALEIAQQRNRAAASTKLQSSMTEAQRSQQGRQQAEATARQGLTQLGQQLSTRDGVAEYRRKAGIAVGMLQQTMPNIDPRHWVSTFQRVYDKVPAAPAAPRAAAPAAKTGAQPMRGNKRPSGQSPSKQPKTLFDAISGAFESDG